MLRAYYSMPAAEFIAQLRTYVIAMGLSTQVVDAVDELAEMESSAKESELQQAADDAAVLMKNEILEAVKKWFDQQDMPLLKREIIDLIEDI